MDEDGRADNRLMSSPTNVEVSDETGTGRVLAGSSHALVVVDQDDFAKCLVDVVCSLGPSWYAVRCATGEEARTALLHSSFDIKLVIVDLVLPDVSGLGIIELTRRARPKAFALVISAVARDADVLAAIKRGAHGYLHKEDPDISLFNGIKSVVQGNYPISPSLGRILFREISKGSGGVQVGRHLTHREKQILKLVGAGETYADVADRLGITFSTVQTHIKNIYAKLETNSKDAALEKARQAGIL